MTASPDPVDESLLRLGRRLAGARVEKGMTQRECAEKAGVPANTISELESGKRLPRIDTVARYARALGLELTVRDTAA